MTIAEKAKEIRIKLNEIAVNNDWKFLVLFDELLTALSEPEEQTEPDYKQMWKALEKRVNSFTGFSEEWIRDEMRNCMKLAHDNTEIEKDCSNCDQSEECNSHIELWCPKLEKYVRLNHVCDD